MRHFDDVHIVAAGKTGIFISEDVQDTAASAHFFDGGFQLFQQFDVRCNNEDPHIRINQPQAEDALDVLSKLGGFDIAGLAGAFIGGSLCRIPMIIDGFISAVSALTAIRLCPRVADYLLASHLSAEPAAALVMAALELSPLIHAGMRLGEGTGAVAVLPLLDLALAVFRDLPTFSDIGM